jgi:hypothetical protein
VGGWRRASLVAAPAGKNDSNAISTDVGTGFSDNSRSSPRSTGSAVFVIGQAAIVGVFAEVHYLGLRQSASAPCSRLSDCGDV